MPTDFDPTALARLLSDADGKGIRLVSETLPIPGNHAEAMRVQHETLALNGWPIRGYKVAIRPDGTSVSAPLAHIVAFDDNKGDMFERPVVTAIEIEICFVLGTDLIPRGPDGYTRDTVLEHVAAIRAGIEFMGHRLDHGSKSQPLVFLADRLGNAGYLTGEKLPEDMIAPGLSYDLTITGNGETLFSGPGKHPNADPVAPLVAFANALTQTIPAGAVITTGSLCGAVAIPALVDLEVSGFTGLKVTARSSARAAG